MKRFSALILAMMMAAASFVTGCEEEIKSHEKKQPASFLILLQAYEEGRVFSSAELTDVSCVVTFEDGFNITVPLSEISVKDHRNSQPPEIKPSTGWWSVGDMVLPIKVEYSKSDKESSYVYVYFNDYTLHMHLSNGKHLKFRSVKLDEQERLENELRRKQNIPVIRITTDGGVGIHDKKNYVAGTITINDPENLYSEVTEYTGRMGIRGRGNSTWSFPKKPWKVKLDEKAPLLGMPADKEWALLANYADRTLVRNIVAMKLSEICGFSWTPRMRSVEVYLNGEYQGVYTLCEHKKVSPDRVNINLEDSYYLEIEEQQDETIVWKTGMGVPMMFSEPEEPTDAQFSYVKQYFEDFEASLRSKDFADPDKGYALYIDVPSFIDYYIVQELTKNIDGNLRKSSFITKESGRKLEMYHLWDFDLTLGNCGYFDWAVGNGPENFWIKDFTSGSMRGDNWFNLMMRDPAFVENLQARWNELLPELEKIPHFIDEQTLYLEKAQEHNFQKWDIMESVDWVKFPSLGSYEKEVAYLKEFYTERLQWLDRELNKL